MIIERLRPAERTTNLTGTQGPQGDILFAK
jgi:hypothetical protein